jgi:hypothetical protein
MGSEVARQAVSHLSLDRTNFLSLIKRKRIHEPARLRVSQ